MQGLAVMHIHYDEVINLGDSVDLLLNSIIEESWSIKLCFSS